MPSAFRLLAYAIVTVLVIWLAYQIMTPFLWPAENNIDVLERSLKASETALGQGFSNEIIVQAGEGFSGETFDSKFRNAAFQCNNATLCCPQKESCGFAIEWDGRKVQFNEARNVTVTSRCRFENSLYVCDVYFGEKPGQIEIDSIKTPENVDLLEKKMWFEIAFSNTGNQDAEQTEIEIEVIQRYLEDGEWIERAIEEASKTVSAGKLASGQKKEEKVYINLNENGEFKANIKVSGLEAGYDERIVEFTATGAVENCTAAYCETPGTFAEKCVSRCYCQGCWLGNSCVNILKQSDNVNLSLPPYATLEGAEPNSMGSNIVDMFLKDEMCPSDLTLEEPNALANEIGFKAKNISGDKVKKKFIVNAYLDFGETSQQKIGSIEIEPWEINTGNDVIKSISVDLQPGTYQVELVANEGKEEKEKDYENNSTTLSLEIPDPAKTNALTSLFEDPERFGPCCGEPFSLVEGFVSNTGNTIPLREAIEQGKIKADFAGNGFSINARIQNTVNETIKVEIPIGQVFVDKERIIQNLGKDFSTKVVEIPMCSVWIGNLTAACLNRTKYLPSQNLYDVGEVVQETVILEALMSGNQSLIWQTVENVSTAPNDYGQFGNILVPVPTTLTEEMVFSQEECEAAGLGSIPLCDVWDPIPFDTIADPDSVDPAYCIRP